MKISHQTFDSGWVGLSIELTAVEARTFAERLIALASGEVGHFHIRNDNFDAGPGIADVELSISPLASGSHTVE